MTQSLETPESCPPWSPVRLLHLLDHLGEELRCEMDIAHCRPDVGVTHGPGEGPHFDPGHDRGRRGSVPQGVGDDTFAPPVGPESGPDAQATEGTPHRVYRPSGPPLVLEDAGVELRPLTPEASHQPPEPRADGNDPQPAPVPPLVLALEAIENKEGVTTLEAIHFKRLQASFAHVVPGDGSELGWSGDRLGEGEDETPRCPPSGS